MWPCRVGSYLLKQHSKLFLFSLSHTQVLTKKKLQDLVREVDPNEQLDEDVEEVGTNPWQGLQKEQIWGSPQSNGPLPKAGRVGLYYAASFSRSWQPSAIHVSASQWSERFQGSYGKHP